MGLFVTADTRLHAGRLLAPGTWDQLSADLSIVDMGQGHS
jgi:hypothetical protein